MGSLKVIINLQSHEAAQGALKDRNKKGKEDLGRNLVLRKEAFQRNVEDIDQDPILRKIKNM